MLQVDPEQVREDAVVDHVAHEAAQLRVGTHRRHQLVERHRVEHDIVPERVELQRRVVDDRGARIERQDVFFRGFRVHRNQEVDFLFPSDIAALAGANRVPGREAGDIRREHVLPGYRDTHQENRAQQDHVGRLATRAIDGRHLDAEIVHDALGAGCGFLFLNREICR